MIIDIKKEGHYMIGFIILALLARAVLTIFGGSRLEGFFLAWVISLGLEPQALISFMVVFIGTKALSAPADVFLIVNSRRDPLLHNMKQRAVAEGLGHLMVKQIALTQTLIGGCVLFVGALFGVLADGNDALMSVLLSPVAIVGLQVWFAYTGMIKNGGMWWLKLYLVGLAMYSMLGWSFLGGSNGYGMLIALNLLFFNWADLFPKGRIPTQVTAMQLGMKALPWGKYGISYRGMFAGMVSGFFIGCPSSLAAEALLGEYERPEERVAVHTAASAASDAMSMVLWMYFGFSRSSYADALGKAGIGIEQGSLVAFALAIILISAISLLIVEGWSYAYMTKERLMGKLLNLIVFISTLVLCGVMAGPLVVILSMITLALIELFKVRYPLPDEAKLGMLGVIPLVSINWMEFIV